jgi:hypothetical protein
VGRIFLPLWESEKFYLGTALTKDQDNNQRGHSEEDRSHQIGCIPQSIAARGSVQATEEAIPGNLCHATPGSQAILQSVHDSPFLVAFSAIYYQYIVAV